jgi:hypothetical protein
MKCFTLTSLLFLIEKVNVIISLESQYL